jgi:hypothetical protein
LSCHRQHVPQDQAEPFLAQINRDAIGADGDALNQ